MDKVWIDLNGKRSQKSRSSCSVIFEKKILNCPKRWDK